MMAIKLMRPVFVVLMALMVLLVRPSLGYGRGAPDTACSDMVPNVIFSFTFLPPKSMLQF